MQQLKVSVDSGSSGDVESQIASLKQTLIQLPSMPPSPVQNPSELSAIRGAYELLLQAFIKSQNISGIQQCFDMLKTLYYDYSPVIGASERFFEVMGLYLTYLLSFNKIEEFHCELEAIPFEQRQNSFIRFAVELEQYFMEGNYQQVLAAADHCPAQTFYFFLNRILDTIRFEIAASFEKAYSELTVKGACELLKLSTEQELRDFISAFKKQNPEGAEWVLEGNWLKIKGEEAKVAEIPHWELIKRATDYSIELERIV